MPSTERERIAPDLRCAGINIAVFRYADGFVTSLLISRNCELFWLHVPVQPFVENLVACESKKVRGSRLVRSFVQCALYVVTGDSGHYSSNVKAVSKRAIKNSFLALPSNNSALNRPMIDRFSA